MKLTVSSTLKIIPLLLCLILTPDAKAKGPDIIYPITILLLSKASSMQQINTPASFSWQTSKNLNLEIGIMTSDEYGNVKPADKITTLAVYAVSAHDGAFPQLLLKRSTDMNGKLKLGLTLPASSSRIKVTALTSSIIKPSKIIELTGNDNIEVSLNLRNSSEGDGRGAVSRADW